MILYDIFFVVPNTRIVYYALARACRRIHLDLWKEYTVLSLFISWWSLINLFLGIWRFILCVFALIIYSMANATKHTHMHNWPLPSKTLEAPVVQQHLKKGANLLLLVSQGLSQKDGKSCNSASLSVQVTAQYQIARGKQYAVMILFTIFFTSMRHTTDTRTAKSTATKIKYPMNLFDSVWGSSTVISLSNLFQHLMHNCMPLLSWDNTTF